MINKINKGNIIHFLLIMLIAILAINMLGFVSAASETITNTTSGGLKTVIELAKSNDKIILSNGVYLGENNRGITINKNLTIIGKSKGKVIINAQNEDRVFTINKGLSVTIVNITIINGNAYKNSEIDWGGAVYNKGTLKIENSNFSYNKAFWGGVVYNEGSFTVKNSNFAYNNAEEGGAIYNTARVNVRNSKFTHNTADMSGAIYSTGSVDVRNSKFTYNKVIIRAGAIYNNWGKLTVILCTFNNNQVKTGDGDVSSGGAIYNCGKLLIKKSNFKYNKADGGGAIYAEEKSNIGVYGSNFINNKAYWGTIFSSDSKMIISSSNFINNKAEIGGAIYNADNSRTKVSTSNFKNNGLIIKNVGTNGGAIFNDEGSSLNIIKSKFSNNHADEAGAINNWGKLNIFSSIFINNKAVTHGGVFSNTGNLTISNSKFLNNRGTDSGSISNWGKLKINKSSFTKSTSKVDGGAISNFFGNITITNSVFTKNKVKYKNYAGAIYNYAGQLEISNSYFIKNNIKNKYRTLRNIDGFLYWKNNKFG